MIAHTVLYVILSVLSATAVYAVGAPLSKPTHEPVEPGEERREDGNSLQ